MNNLYEIIHTQNRPGPVSLKIFKIHSHGQFKTPEPNLEISTAASTNNRG